MSVDYEGLKQRKWLLKNLLAVVVAVANDHNYRPRVSVSGWVTREIGQQLAFYCQLRNLKQSTITLRSVFLSTSTVPPPPPLLLLIPKWIQLQLLLNNRPGRYSVVALIRAHLIFGQLVSQLKLEMQILFHFAKSRLSCAGAIR